LRGELQINFRVQVWNDGRNDCRCMYLWWLSIYGWIISLPLSQSLASKTRHGSSFYYTLKLPAITCIMFSRITSVLALAATLVQAYSGVATFNNYASQSNTVCGPFSGVSGTYGAAISDVSPNIWSGNKCSGSIDDSECNGQSPISGYSGPACPTTTCGECFQVCNEGGYDGATVSGVGNCIIINIIDACPSESAYNFCKTDVPAAERCGSTSTNAVDIDVSAYAALTGTSWTSSSPNLEISIVSSSC